MLKKDAILVYGASTTLTGKGSKPKQYTTSLKPKRRQITGENKKHG
jgi:hypothetical protein